MSSVTSSGSLRTRIIVEMPDSVKTGRATKVDKWKNVFGEGATIHADWKRKMTRFDSTVDNVENDRVTANETAKVKIRYCKGVTGVCRVKRIGDEEGYWYVIGSPDRNGGWLEFTVERKAAAL